MKRRILKKVVSVVLVLVSLAIFLVPATANTEPLYKGYNEITFNPSGPEFNTGKLNPFSVPAIREAMNILIDREYISEQIFNGYYEERWLPIANNGQFYEMFSETTQSLETIYAHDFSTAEATITQEMLDLGATKVDGLWHYADEPVELIFLIRIEDERIQIGDYISDLLEEIGFLVDRQYKTSSEASPLWMSSDPQDGLWHLYTGGWLSKEDADENENFQFFYTPEGDQWGSPLWQAYEPTPEFWALANLLADNWDDMTPEDDPIGSFIQALEWAMEDSVRIFLVEEKIARNFIDVPSTHWAFDWISRLYAAGITAGCSEEPPLFCPGQDVTRAQMAVFLERGMRGPEYKPLVGTGTIFADVTSDHWAVDWIELLFADEITEGCAENPLRYCPDLSITRAQMVVFLLRAKHGADYIPPEVGESSGFNDVLTTDWAAAWIKQAAAEGITAGCGNNNFCPVDPVTREQMAVFLVVTFDLP